MKIKSKNIVKRLEKYGLRSNSPEDQIIFIENNSTKKFWFFSQEEERVLISYFNSEIVEIPTDNNGVFEGSFVNHPVDRAYCSIVWEEDNNEIFEQALENWRIANSDFGLKNWVEEGIPRQYNFLDYISEKLNYDFVEIVDRYYIMKNVETSRGVAIQDIGYLFVYIDAVFYYDEINAHHRLVDDDQYNQMIINQRENDNRSWDYIQSQPIDSEYLLEDWPEEEDSDN
jgi:hypothetical protein